jgi:hypothetical protein
LNIAQAELNKAQAQLDEKQKELDVVQAMYDSAMKEKQASTFSASFNVLATVIIKPISFMGLKFIALGFFKMFELSNGCNVLHILGRCPILATIRKENWSEGTCLRNP